MQQKPRILVINSAEPEVTTFWQPIAKLLEKYGASCQLAEYRESKQGPPACFNGVIITGSPQGDNIVEHHQAWFQWIKTCDKPVLGICAGHHITGFMYGAKYLRSAESESGITEIRQLKQDELFSGMPAKFKVREMHNDSITVPVSFELLASSAVCRNQAMKHQDRPIYTLQFHPEFMNHLVFRNFLTIVKRGMSPKSTSS
ncbi:type 1 glutamine amidotransferase [Gaoshiqia sp. Z1-71]|uniref:type 1 glutamine amidotransferase n=1 Tax=Gaoshiqia hydrogeniformans TaxID=3290090 RepID=UPI003BF7BCD0